MSFLYLLLAPPDGLLPPDGLAPPDGLEDPDEEGLLYW